MNIVNRPWGNFKEFIKNKKCTVKILEIKPRQELSLQKHKERNEVWYFLTNGRIQLGKHKIKIRKGQIIKIKRNQPHRAIAGNREMRFLEISLGKFSEGDEIRLEDKYGRK